MDNIQKDPDTGDEEAEEDIPTFGGDDSIVITMKENEGIFNLAIWRYYLKFFN